MPGPEDELTSLYKASEGSGMTVVNAEGKARTMNFHANDVSFVTAMAGHYIENTGNDDLIFLEMFNAPRFMDSPSTSGSPECPTRWQWPISSCRFR